MKPPVPAQLEPREDDAPDLPGLKSWPAVYLFVLASFVLWIFLLIVLTRLYP